MVYAAILNSFGIFVIPDDKKKIIVGVKIVQKFCYSLVDISMICFIQFHIFLKSAGCRFLISVLELQFISNIRSDNYHETHKSTILAAPCAA